ncbi:GEVED domain-containing protein [Fluviicola taffensis]|uniref:Lysyl endopeptidase n=1 Tax=Fluviicola taffensis (strain DSM 16823 / NCIMB 13979 / RW262) TaxID=755732 RepID=F2IFW3_FLUTR|nr:GEVED domain-containing protein [Fluviicola taffensis]AEA43584.1 Lysyl endopeptidase [Fluviicola taffensis DSM 16823]
MLKIVFILSTILCFVNVLKAQVSEGGIPISLQKINATSNSPFTYSQAIYTLSKPNIVAAKNDDALNDSKGAYRVGLNLPVSITMTNSGTWSLLPDGTKVWRLIISGKDAMALGLYFSESVQIPAGGKLFAYNENGKQILGSYTSSTDDFQAMEMVQGEKMYLEYSAPSWVQETPVFNINEVVYFYRGVEEHVGAFSSKSSANQEKAANCQVDVACTEGNNWANQIKSVVHYTFNDGTGTYVCSASTINNTSNDCKPYILTAWHCGERVAGQSISTWVWYWKYQKTTCATGSQNQNDPSQGTKTMTGGTVRASSGNGTLNNPPGNGKVAGSDFYLVELSAQPPASYEVYYAGWDRTNTGSASGVGIHHPDGSAKKISTYTQGLSSSNFNGGAANAHWAVFWATTANGHGVTEGGSSGSPLFNTSGRIVGQLTGGGSACTVNGAGNGTGPNEADVYGKLFTDWDLNGTTNNARLKPWLDATNTGATAINGIAAPCTVTPNAPVAQFVANPTTVTSGGVSQFTDQSTGSPTSWAWIITPATGWAYSGGTNASSQNPQVTFNTTGTYTVQLTATNTSGSDVELKTNYIVVTNSTGPCTASSTFCDEFIQNVSLATINNQSTCNNYTSYNIGTTLTKGQLYSITITPQITGQAPGSAYTGDEIAAWIDFNGDFDFDDVGERIAFVSITAGASLVFNFTVPQNATSGSVKMRVRISYNATQGGEGPINPCGNTNYGEVEDYNIILSNPLGLEQNYLDVVSIYPNPANDEVTIDLAGLEAETISVELMDMTGKILQTQKQLTSNTGVFDLRNLAQGSYQLRITDGTIQRIARIVKL